MRDRYRIQTNCELQQRYIADSDEGGDVLEGDYLTTFNANMGSSLLGSAFYCRPPQLRCAMCFRCRINNFD